MSNSYYTFTPEFVPGTKVRAAAVNRQYTLIQQAFDLLPTSTAALPLGKATLGTESGSGNAYVVTMPNTRTVNAEGDEVVFKATHQNSGPSTLKVDGTAAVALVRFNGDALSSADVLTGTYYTTRFNSTTNSFEIVSPALQTTAGALVYATPTGKAKLAASAGSATSLIRSDADIAIDQTISPTWTGVHRFTGSIDTPSVASSALLIGKSGAANAEVSFINSAGAVNGKLWHITVSTGSIQFDASTDDETTSREYLVASRSAGTITDVRFGNANDNPTLTFSGTGVVTGSGVFRGPAGSNTAPTWSFSGDSNTGAYSVGADDWGVTTGGTLRFDISTTAVTSTLPLLANAGSNTAPSHSFSGDSNTGVYSAGADDIGITTGGTLRFDISTTAVTSTLPLLANAGSNTAPSHSFSGDSNTGIYNSSADRLAIGTGGTIRMEIRAGSIDFYPTGTLTSSIQATGYYNTDGSASAPPYSWQNDATTGFYRDTSNQIAIALGGVTAGQIAQGTFTVTYTGFTTTVTGTASWQQVGKVLILTLPANTATSNATTFTATGVPAAIRPTTTQFTALALATDNATVKDRVSAQVNSGGTIDFYLAGNNAGWTASSTKGFSQATTLKYQLV